VSSTQAAEVIVVGSGHNGLVAACYLAKAGIDVLILEAFDKPGGMTATSFMTPEAPEHQINEASIQPSLFRTTNISKELGLESKYGLRMRVIDPAHVHMQEDGSSLALWRDPAKTAQELKHFSRRDAEEYLKVFRTIDAAVAIGLPMMQTSPVRPEFKAILKMLRALGRNARELAAVGRWAASSFVEAVEDSFESDIIKAQMAINLPFMRFHDDGGGWGLIYLGIMRKYGTAMFEGGTGNFPRALCECLRDAGGRVRCSAPVEELIVRDGRVVGVRLAGGEEIHARRGVLTAMSPKTALTRLLPRGVLPPKLQVRADNIPTRNRGIADFKMDVAVKGRIELARHERWRGDGVDLRMGANSFNTWDEVLAAFRACTRGEIPEKVCGLGQVTTGLAPELAPEGHDTFWMWCGLTPPDPRDDWDTVRATLQQRAIEHVNKFYVGVEDLQIGARTLVLPDIEERFNAIDGSVYHVDPVITRFGPRKPAPGFAGYSTPVPGLFLTGSGTHPVAGISGMPGRNAAVTMLRVFKREQSKSDSLADQRAQEQAVDASLNGRDALPASVGAATGQAGAPIDG
jgi:phytoene dehydrogenase-like protein